MGKLYAVGFNLTANVGLLSSGGDKHKTINILITKNYKI